jgi:hypothetical protein
MRQPAVPLFEYLLLFWNIYTQALDQKTKAFINCP